MTMQIRSRLPSVPSLSKILSAGTEGGKEFARIVDILLYFDARSRGHSFQIFNDAAGDYNALDAFSGGFFRQNGSEGYQYKFFSSPLSLEHKREVQASLNAAIKRAKESKLQSWTLVTPDDFLEQGAAKKGDVTWFEGLREQGDKAGISVEHVGHTKLIALFLKSSNMCLRYYPELVVSGEQFTASFDEIKRLYDQNFQLTRGHIEFVGMSVYKEEATRGVPLEQIYIPLSVINESSDDADDKVPRINPLAFLSPGTRTVILGDPGSGKSTLLSFLGLSGLSPSLIQRYNTKKDERLPIIIVLRRYADELKSRKTLSILEFIEETIRADYNLNRLSQSFILYHLETGNALVCFDGLDELPSTAYKKIVRDRVESFATTYPGNTTLITSRIVGYEAGNRFSSRRFNHFKIARLLLPEIETFIQDWYCARVESESERTANVRDLTRIIAEPSNEAIRDLASNPLLLTIVALVHRIDAVLPDERVILYQKCTETLLNTWYKWKFLDEIDRSKGRLERKNRLRIESIAYWMQSNSSNSKGGRAVAPYNELLNHLIKHIEDREKSKTVGEEPEDQAEEFLKFVRSRTGLLIEAGDQRYSFVHLTFQEYLAATHLLTLNEEKGVSAIWEEIRHVVLNPRWHEVVRLLIASFKSDESQHFFIGKLLEALDGSEGVAGSLLLGGLLLDGISAAEDKEVEVIGLLARSAAKAQAAPDIKLVDSMLRTWDRKSKSNSLILKSEFSKILRECQFGEHIRVALASSRIDACTLQYGTIWKASTEDVFVKQFFKAVVHGVPLSSSSAKLRLERFLALVRIWLIDSPDANLVASACIPFLMLKEGIAPARALFDAQMICLGAYRGPFHDHLWNLIGLSASQVEDPIVPVSDVLSHPREARQRKSKSEQLEDIIEKVVGPVGSESRAETDNCFSRVKHRVQSRLEKKRRSPKSNRQLRDVRGSMAFFDNYDTNIKQYWNGFYASPAIDFLLGELTTVLDLRDRDQWQETLRLRFIREIPRKVAFYFEKETLRQLMIRFRDGRTNENDLFCAAWFLLVDVWASSVGSLQP